MKQINFLVLITLLLNLSVSGQTGQRNIEMLISNNHNLEFNISIPTTGNSWLINDAHETPELISTEGIVNWSDVNQIIRTYFYVTQPGKISLGIKAKVRSGVSVIKVTFGNNSKNITLSNKDFEDIYIGDFDAKTIGYYFVDIQGLERADRVYADVKDIVLGTDTDSTSIKYIKDDFYFGRRGPSTHLNYNIPKDVKEAEWFYNEVLIPKNQDVIGSFFMTNGFGEGYFGIQVNSESERRILFSVWSPYKTDKPGEIPEDLRVKLLKKGKDVTAGKFGGEGSGGQSYKVYNWKAEVKYKFLIGAKPASDNSTDYTAYFYDPEKGNWDLIAKFRRPKTNTYLKRLHSFLENFIPEQGVFSRKGTYLNQWICDSDGHWHEITKATFSADLTARKESRLDYSGGVEGQGFFLMNCGFTNDNVKIGTEFMRNKLMQKPTIDFGSLE